MAILNGYATLADLKLRLDIPDGADDAILEGTIEAASRRIDEDTGRRFYLVTEARYFTPEQGGLVEVDDLITLTDLATDIAGTRTYDTVWQPTDYDLLPTNAASRGWPYTAIARRPLARWAFPILPLAVRVTGDWGYAAAPPAPIVQACLLLAARLWRRKDAAVAEVGTMGSEGLAQVRTYPSNDPDVRQLLAPYRRMDAFAI